MSSCHCCYAPCFVFPQAMSWFGLPCPCFGLREKERGSKRDRERPNSTKREREKILLRLSPIVLQNSLSLSLSLSPHCHFLRQRLGVVTKDLDFETSTTNAGVTSLSRLLAYFAKCPNPRWTLTLSPLCWGLSQCARNW
jgi:hypothetical protein